MIVLKFALRFLQFLSHQQDLRVLLLNILSQELQVVPMNLVAIGQDLAKMSYLLSRLVELL